MIEIAISNAKYLADDNGQNIAIEFQSEGETKTVMLNATGNRHYAEIMRQVDAGTLTIADAE